MILFSKCARSAPRDFRCKFLTNNDTGRTSALEVFVQVLIFFSACKSNDLCCNVCTELLLACAVLDININTKLALLKADELKRNNIGSLMQ